MIFIYMVIDGIFKQKEDQVENYLDKLRQVLCYNDFGGEYWLIKSFFQQRNGNMTAVPLDRSSGAKVLLRPGQRYPQREIGARHQPQESLQ